ncbi:uncharacterized protein DUF3298 [Anseongella ginsenosidimutans]|uniref:Uncharacterized protein DUF3298 n=1 Tax=Anseongella ginsenosidimutans TaxID=496056 RepID=A0A4R3KRL7_9SPHI|nr:DUF3298 and DUF4163 domain-containing protein [Anseongella ginsenosidimutans]QEC52977.1 DUF3298 and DUF4163 domain-containing protein [Anseongella ginsenosidimutans]TCS87381.1 uncharacterized protein DUF3298 [Anseongella ginsenosidimutans]
MNKLYLLILIPTLSVPASCGGGNNRNNSGDESENTVKFVTMETYEQESDCDTAQTECTSIYFSYPRIVGSGNRALNDTLSLQIERWLTGSADTAETGLSPEAFGKAFINDYEKFSSEFPDSRAKWFIRREVEIIANNDHFITLQLSEENYLGGAHGMNIHLFANFIPSGGHRIYLDELVAEGQMETLEKIAESLFREETGIPEGQSLKDAGYFYMENDGGGSPFHLTENFAITREGLLFYYNPYDIAPYSMGSTVLKVPFDKVEGTLKRQGILEGML